VSHRFDLAALLKRADVVKASSEELARLTDASRSVLADRIVLETRGRYGTVIYGCSEEIHVRAKPVDVSDTIGAGDTFLAAFVVSLIDGASPPDAVEMASRFTEEWLRIVKSPGTTARSDR
jgi:sugar/nucleoside kinase (ribokinase family)